MLVIPKKTFLLRQEEIEGGKKKDVIAKKGVKIEMSEKEAIAFWGGLDLNEKDQKRLLAVAKAQGYKRKI